MDETVTTQSPEETRQWAGTWATRLPPGSVLALHGDLGAGKTCFVQGLAAALQVSQTVSSPTYTLIHEYQGAGECALYHVDLYRIHSAEEALDLGLDEYMNGDGITVIEWAERAESILPTGTIHLTFRHGAEPTVRTITVGTERQP